MVQVRVIFIEQTIDTDHRGRRWLRRHSLIPIYLSLLQYFLVRVGRVEEGSWMSLQNKICSRVCMYHPLAMTHSVIILVGNEMFEPTIIVAVAVLRPCSSDTLFFPPQQSSIFGHRASSQTV
jgi:hypothetical protein